MSASMDRATRNSERGTRNTEYILRLASRLALLVVCCLLLAACSFPGSVQPTVKIGLSAPFEGLYRDQGYEALQAVRLAVRLRNQSGGVGGRYLVELVALNDFSEPQEVVKQARKMAVDPGVLGVVGGFSPEAAASAAAEYRRSGLAFLAPEQEALAGAAPVSIGPEFIEGYQALSGGVPPGPIAVWAYGATNRLLDAIDVAARTTGRPSRDSVVAALATDPLP